MEQKELESDYLKVPSMIVKKISVDRHNQQFREDRYSKSDVKTEYTGRVRKYVKEMKLSDMKVQGFSTGENFYPSNGNSSHGIQIYDHNQVQSYSPTRKFESHKDYHLTPVEAPKLPNIKHLISDESVNHMYQTAQSSGFKNFGKRNPSLPLVLNSSREESTYLQNVMNPNTPIGVTYETMKHWKKQRQ